MTNLDIYDPPEPREMWLLHDPVSDTEVVITPNANREKIRQAVDSGAVIIHRTADGERTVGTIDQLPQAEPNTPIRLVVPEYVDARIDLINSMFSTIINALQGYLPQSRVSNLLESVKRAKTVIAAGNTEDMQSVAADLGVTEGPSIE